jgi:diguanylate cyclase (GGDEF)-like protein
MTKPDQEFLFKFARNVPGAAFFYTIWPNGRLELQVLNDQVREVFGLPPGEKNPSAEELWGVTHADDLKEMQASVRKSAEVLCYWEHSWRVTDYKGRQRWLRARGTPEAMPDGSVRWLTFAFDITAQITAEAEAAKAVNQLAVAMEAIPDGFALFDENERFVTCNATYLKLFPASAHLCSERSSFEDILRNDVCSGNYDLPADQYETLISQRLASYRRGEGTMELQRADRRWMRLLERATSTGGRVVFAIDVTETKARQAELENAALTDALTGLLNRRGISERISNTGLWVQPEERIAFLHLDLDKFKTVNDALGHEAGDHVLTTVSHKLVELAGTRAEVARVGGDEFVIALPTEAEQDYIYEFAVQLRATITKPNRFKGRLCQVGASIGISLWCPAGFDTVEQALLDADTALMQGKTLGRNQTVVFRDEMRAKAVETAQIASRIKDSLREGQFIPYFQPQIEWPNGKVFGFETLVRWIGKDGTVTPASAFINVADETGLILDIDREMLTRGLDALDHFNSMGLDRPSISINLSGALLRSPDLLDTVLDAVGWRGIDHEQINIEIIESTLLDDRSDMIASNINALASAGFRIELDDFGTGHTALASLRQYPVHRIKIDRSLITSIDSDPSLQAITEGIFSLCQRLGIETIAEGIETDAELAQLQHIGISRFQGYRLAKPMPFHEVTDWLAARGSIERRA